MPRSVGLCVVAGAVLVTPAVLRAAPPKVVKASPDRGDLRVDPASKAIRITFDQPMARGGMSVVGGGERFPKITDQPRWENARTLVIPVRLEPGHDYWLSINSDRFANFKNAAGESAEPYPIQFRTASGKAAGTKPDPDLASRRRQAAAKLYDAVRYNYSHRDRLGVDWRREFVKRREALLKSADADEFAAVAARILSAAKDKHIWLQVDGRRTPAYVRPVTPNGNLDVLPTVVPDFQQRNGLVASGRWPQGVGYLAIHGWARERESDLIAAYDVLSEFQDAPALILDVRFNSGGDERLARDFAGCFVEKPAVYARRDACDAGRPGKFTTPRDIVIEPNAQRPHFRGHCAVLTGPVVISSCESFVLMMKQVPGVIIVGAPTQGSSGNPQPYDLGNGVTVFLPIWRESSPAGVELEGRGIAPDVRVQASRADFAAGDPVIEAALARLVP